VPIGKIDPTSGQPIYKPEYAARMMAAGAITQEVAATAFTREDILQSSVLEYGAMYLLESIAQQVGILDALQRALPTVHQEIFTLACYLVLSGDPFLYCEEWMSKTSCQEDVGSLSSQRISDLLQTVTSEGREAFYQAWCKLRSEQEYLALDITSTRSDLWSPFPSPLNSLRRRWPAIGKTSITYSVHLSWENIRCVR